MQIIWYIVYEKTQKFSASMVQKPQLLPGVGMPNCSLTRSHVGDHLKRKDAFMPPTKTRKSDKRAEFQPEFTPVDEETPLGFFEKFYAPHENPKWQQLAALGLAQIIIDADRRRAEFRKQKAAKPPLP